MAPKILPTQRVSIPNGPLGSYPQTTAPNPSQKNGSNPPAIPPSHRQSGTDGEGNGSAPPFFPGR